VRVPHLLPERADAGLDEEVAVDQELHHELRPYGIEHYRREAKALLRAVRAGDAQARSRAHVALGQRAGERFVLADALHVVAVEHGSRSWPTFKRDTELQADTEVRPVGRIGASPSATYAEWAERLLSAAQGGEPDAVERLRARVPRLAGNDDKAIAERATLADAEICLAREYGFRTWAELADAADRAHETHYSGLPAESPWKRAEAAIHAGDAAQLRELLERHPGLEHEDPGMTLLSAAAQPEAGTVPREVVDVLIEAGSELDVPLNLAACFNKATAVGWLLDAGADAAAAPIWGITPLQTATYHGSREAVDVLVERTGLLPDAFYIAAAADDIERLAAWFDGGRLRPGAMRERPNLADVGWPPCPPARDDPADVLAEALSLAAQLDRTRACEELLARGADPSSAPLYGITPLHFAASMNRRESVAILVRRGAPLDARDRLHQGTPLEWALHHGVTDDALLMLLR
jgi:Ankyrin repeats (3 copies)